MRSIDPAGVIRSQSTPDWNRSRLLVTTLPLSRCMKDEEATIHDVANQKRYQPPIDQHDVEAADYAACAMG
ncbi:hypothetical protein [Sphingomonas sp. CLY1604]|uniref:hypothetical protein n=1 Tax=Sphingomonas sp. CLY1604 TaxID=3457786 RepID=UPI003FD8AC3D